VLDKTLVKAAKAALGTDTINKTIERSLTLVVQQSAADELAKWIMEPDPTFAPTPRRKAV
jgi:hypothetical protein